ncbi:MAG: sigma 54-interacting transcriptional regulator [Bdellovibrionales bacterium]|nr:sigma 54-interacting transcriptional regulator [Bdellovibrionales bacterium]
MKTTADLSNLICAVIGPVDFGRRVGAFLNSAEQKVRWVSGTLSEAWSLIVTARPNLIIVEIGLHHSERQQVALRRLLGQVRERYGDQVYICIAITASEKFYFGGDLLFGNDLDLTPSGFVNTFIATPPSLVPSIPGISQQLQNVLELISIEFARQTQGHQPLPPLGAEGWVDSLADPLSRELWMKWLPRYASYTNENPIIIGETGTGKTKLAYALHLLSGRSGEFVTITPRDFSSSELVQAELFGAVAGAYTGAVDKWGLVKKAEKGSLFIDELQSIDKDLQGKLITFIENKAYRRVGSSESVSADVRFIFASNRTLYDMMETGTLRDDFAYRLERVQLELRSLQDRRLDIVSALSYALAKIQRQRPQALPCSGLTSQAYRMVFCRRWPGNLRQLENAIAQFCEITDIQGKSVIDASVVTQAFGTRPSGLAASGEEVISQAAYRFSQLVMQQGISSLQNGTEIFTELIRLTALEATAGDAPAAAQLIGEDLKVLELLAESRIAHAEVKQIT